MGGVVLRKKILIASTSTKLGTAKSARYVEMNGPIVSAPVKSFSLFLVFVS